MRPVGEARSYSPDVTVLIESPELKKTYGNGAVAVTFRWHNGKVATGNSRTATGGKASLPEGGCVLHVLGHFKLEPFRVESAHLEQLAHLIADLIRRVRTTTQTKEGDHER